MKKILCIILSLVILLSFVGCKKDDKKEPEEENKEPVTEIIEGYIDVGTSLEQLELRTEKGSYSFNLDGAAIKTTDTGFYLDGMAKVTYIGDLKDMASVEVVMVEMILGFTSEMQSAEASEEVTVEGKVSKVTSDDITLKMEDKSTITFDIKDAELPEDDLKKKDRVKVTYIEDAESSSESESTDEKGSSSAIKVEKIEK